jgi:hypothetical protein
MRWLPKAIPVLIAVIALDFAMVFGFEAVRIFTSPIYGLDRLAFANVVYGIGSFAGLGAEGHINFAASLGAVYLTIAIIFALHIASRIGALRGGPVSHDLLDAGLILVVVATLVVATPAILNGASQILIQERLPLWLVGLAATLSMIERFPESETRPRSFVERLWLRYVARRKRAEGQMITPAVRDDGAAIRWDNLRGEAGMVMQAVKVPESDRPWFALRLR